MIFMAISALCMSACKTRGASVGVGQSDAKEELTGVFAGTLPCASCPGIQTKIELLPEGTYTMQTVYIDQTEGTFTHSGKFEWDASNRVITFDNELVAQCLLEGNTLSVLVDGKKHTGPIADHYVLTKVDTNLVEKYWKLTELNGNPVEAADSGRGEAHIIFRIEGNRFNGNAGCNRMMGSYQIREDGKISFSQAASTKMMCLNMDVEHQFLQVINTADGYAVQADTLTLTKENEPLARFVVVYL